MTAAVIYESMFGNTRRIADAIADGLSGFTDAGVERASANFHPYVDLVVIGAPTHAHSLPSEASRADAAKWAAEPGHELTLEPSAVQPGVREWLDAAEDAPVAWAAFATRVDIPRIFAGDASAGIERRMRRLHSHPVVHSECFLVTLENILADGELDRAREWGRSLGRSVFAPQTPQSD